MTSIVVPTPGRDVLYKSKTGNYVLPAKVSVTVDNLYRPGVESGDLADLASPLHVHLKVINPGPEYVEFNVPHAMQHEDYDGGLNPWPPGTWAWPRLVPDRVYDIDDGTLTGELLPYVRLAGRG